MIDLTRTTTQLLEGLRRSDDARAWGEFESRYRVLLQNFARRLGLSEADAEDAAQEAITRFVSEYRQGKYDREKGRLRAWLIGIVRYRALECRRRGARAPGALPQDDQLLDDEATITGIWEQEQRGQVLRAAMDELHQATQIAPRTLRAFDLSVTRGLPPGEVASMLGMSVHDVYLARSRCLTRLREIIRRAESVYDADE